MVPSARAIHLDDARDDRLAQLPLTTAYTYAYLPALLDDEGRAKDQPAVFNGYLWPLRADEHPTAAMIDDISALVDAGLLCRYSVDGHDYIHDTEWRRRQKLRQPGDFGRSVLPRCPTHGSRFDDVIGETLSTVTAQVGALASKFGAARVRDVVTRMVEDVPLPIDPQQASVYSQRVREFLGTQPDRNSQANTATHGDRHTTTDPVADVWKDATEESPPLSE
jgi:hypothetical protein